LVNIEGKTGQVGQVPFIPKKGPVLTCLLYSGLSAMALATGRDLSQPCFLGRFALGSIIAGRLSKSVNVTRPDCRPIDTTDAVPAWASSMSLVTARPVSRLA
jgi:hypothetical protein